MTVRIEHGDSRDVLKTLPDASVDACVTDPPYSLVSIQKRFGKPGSAEAQYGRDGVYKRAAAGFMGKQWDTGETAFDPAFWAEVYRVLKPGAYALAFGGTRTYHRLACAIEDAGFEIRDQLMYLYGSGFPKAHNLKNKPEIFCQCNGDPVPYSHGTETAQHNLRPLRHADLSTVVNAGDERRQVLFASLPESGVSERGTARSQSEAGGQEQPGLEGRALHRAGQGLCDGAQAGSPAGASERLRSGAHLSGGEDAGPSAYRNGGGPPQGLEPGEQRPEQPQGVCEPSGALDGRALPHGGCCPRCGKLTKAFKGFSTALKPAVEPIVLARKPLSEKTVAANVQQHGTGGLNIDGCRVSTDGEVIHTPQSDPSNRAGVVGTDLGISRADAERFRASQSESVERANRLGRWPANVIHDGSEEVIAGFPESESQRSVRTSKPGSVYGMGAGLPSHTGEYGFNDSGSAARFFYTAKADADDRLGSKHPTVKPVDLMAYLCRLVCPPGGTVLDPFAGSGTTGMACMREGFDCILIEREAEYVADIRRRLAHVNGEDTPLFEGRP